ncbi:bidirectional hydrogenase complex protein HoxE [Aphanizomenon flos-aquae NRERC-008]|jgi:bidirectional [NiFe] hydrogenase diaphorase subunit|uniref:Bidirectional hydrogenase complex protein HoxE n=2 Tax=Aphanizomenon flos-aquae TaxID=1176 RepID=A0ABR8IWS3_APHFL|nr:MULTISPECIES: bidirectional hydrogenase complex protein HoxE [Aphanizomenon]MBD1217301.1 bidirectional hydrogenase complex protein HoxE [Aphanizomenon flos-aquae Clear-A1]MBO1042592.1 bidirectional hydrogenase complex protein HoxE [Aphanizomenon flos-aquae UKL13-PB]MBO1062239.1 bidirectional hydrogenase complex protein HoxE [Aphanizomenon flos-aquae CP01]MCE2905470.1 bidirectional hydrogenase complex protein HoxE [Anabaena sp. CoA2_C59]MDJ0505958.1 bidirectional hydrogenase complex protein 
MKTSIPPSSTHLIEDKRLKMLDATIKRHQYQQDALIEILHRACELFGYLELDLLLYIAHSLKLPPSRVYGVATFYHLFSLAPKGVHNCVVCTGTACYVKGAQTILTNVEQFTQIHAGETTPNGQISLMTARCLGACGIAPAVVFDGTVLGNQTPDSVCEKVRAWWQNGTK